jgi:hypothetical protein
LRLISPPVQLRATARYQVVIHTDSAWWPTISIEGSWVQGEFRLWWPWNPLASFLRIRLAEEQARELAKHKALASSLENGTPHKQLHP